MATSGTATFNLDILEIIEEAYEQAGLEVRTGYDIKTARRSLNLLALDWANRGYNLWTVEQGAVPLIAGVNTYTLPADTIDIIESVIRTTTGGTSTDLSLARIGMAVYATIPVKTTQGRPYQVWIDRQGSAPNAYFWPVPNDNTYTFVYWRMRRIQDAGASGELTFDIPARFLPCLTAGLACKIALKRLDTMDKYPVLKEEYESLWMNATAEDRERVTTRIIPDLR